MWTALKLIGGILFALLAPQALISCWAAGCFEDDDEDELDDEE